MPRQFFLVLFSWGGLACLLLFASDGILDAEPIDRIFVAASPPMAGKNHPPNSPISHLAHALIPTLSGYLAFLLRSPPGGEVPVSRPRAHEGALAAVALFATGRMGGDHPKA